jgi:hypothetical protein
VLTGSSPFVLKPHDSFGRIGRQLHVPSMHHQSWFTLPMITNTLRGVGELQAGGVALHQQYTAMVHATHDDQYPARRG